MNNLNEINSPFKFLKAFERKDSKVFFGRDKEVNALYDSVNKNRLVMVYGLSGTGKTSLVQCGLASRFDITDWYPIFISRGDDINAALQAELRKAAKRRYQADDLVGTVQALNERFLRPIYLIFDQLEELLILGKMETEQMPFIQSIAKLLAADNLSCHIIFVLREEYLAQLYHFEEVIPTLFDRRLRVEPMRSNKVTEVLKRSFAAFNISLEAEDKNIKQIIKRVSAKKSGIPLPYLQVYLDRLYREDFVRTYPNGIDEPLPPLEFTTAEITEFGEIEDVLAKFLEEQKADLEADFREEYPQAKKESVQKILDSFVTDDGTKRPLVYTLEKEQLQLTESAPDFLRQLPPEQLRFCLDELEERRLVRKTETTYELAHDSLAALIDEARSDEQRLLNEAKTRIKNGLREHQQTGEYFSERQLNSIDYLLPKLQPQLESNLQQFLEDSQNDIKARQNKRRSRIRLTIIAVITAFAIMASLTFWALRQQAKALQEAKEKQEALDSMRAEQLAKEAAQKAKEKAEIIRLHSQAKKYKEAGEILLAKQKWKKILELDSIDIAAKQALENLK